MHPNYPLVIELPFYLFVTGKGLINGREVINLVINAPNLQHSERGKIQRERDERDCTTAAENDGDRQREIKRHRWRDGEKDTYIYS